MVSLETASDSDESHQSPKVTDTRWLQQKIMVARGKCLENYSRIPKFGYIVYAYLYVHFLGLDWFGKFGNCSHIIYLHISYICLVGPILAGNAGSRTRMQNVRDNWFLPGP